MATWKTFAAAAAVVVVLLGGVAGWQVVRDGDGGSARGGATSEARDRPRAPRAHAGASAAGTPGHPPPPLPPGGRFHGRVTGPDGAPVAGASVIAVAVRDLALRGTSPPTTAAASTRAYGTFEVRLPEATAMADVSVSAAGLAVATARRVRPEAAAEIRLAREGVLHGRVADLAGNAFAGAVVRVFRVLGDEFVRETAVVTDAGGEYRIGGFGGADGAERWASTHPPVFDVRAPGFVATHSGWQYPAAGEEMRRDVVLLPTRPLVVLVTDAASGAPLADARVTVGFAAAPLQMKGVDGWTLPHPAPDLEEGPTAEDGTIRLAGAPDRLVVYVRLFVCAWKPGFTAERAVIRFRTQTDDERVEVSLWPAAVVRGRVVDADGGPVAGVRVAVGERDWRGQTGFAAPFGDAPWLGDVPTDEKGCYVVRAARASADGSVAVKLTTWGLQIPDARGRVSALTRDQQPWEVVVHARPGEEVVAPDLVLPRLAQSRGAVFLAVDESGRSVSDAFAYASDARPMMGRADDAGRMRLWFPPSPYSEPKESLVVQIRTPGYAWAFVPCRPSASEPPEMAVTLVRGHRLEGRVHERDGTPVAACRVVASNGLQGDQARWFGFATSDASGGFAIDDLPACSLDVHVSHDAPSRGTKLRGIVPGGAAADVELPPVAVPDLSQFGTIAVRVVDGGGAPLPEARVSLQGGRTPPGMTSSWPPPAPGVTELGRVPAGTWTVAASGTGWLPGFAPATVTAGETTRVTVALGRGTATDVRVTAPVPPPVDGDWPMVYAWRVDALAENPVAFVDVRAIDVDRDRGLVRFDALAPGRYRLRYDVRDGDAHRTYVATSAFDVPPPGARIATAAVELVLGGGVHANVDVRDREYRELMSKDTLHLVTYEVEAMGGERHRVGRGRVWAAVPPGSYRVRIRLPSGRVAEGEVTVRAGETATAELTAFR